LDLRKSLERCCSGAQRYKFFDSRKLIFEKLICFFFLVNLCVYSSVS